MQNTLVTKKMRSTISNIEAELGNAEHFFGVKLPTDLAVEWKSFIRVHLTSTGTTAQSWARTQIGVAQTLIKTESPSSRRRSGALSHWRRMPPRSHDKTIKALEKEAQSKANSTKLRAEIKAEEKVERQYNLAERKRAMLVSSGVTKIIAGLKKDQRVLTKYSGQIATMLKMPTP
ncbi:hypothetical protein BU23DRAFT_570703 [Bimuria novae-zelandiae CBS 107.79]|uniref:Uncharacterized protein n=1 Tax=Bimuria novae-zelandiae CBS 107.79 TaxID=1447943 RepID=A0A6A5V0C9_9PLEO|nr:hypothetical protein BU23DRAFT_570703 [Bimuria novae-zelandiae CBS 107.79]